MSVEVLVKLRQLVGRKDWSSVGEIMSEADAAARKTPSHALIPGLKQRFISCATRQCRACLSELQQAVTEGHLAGEPGSVNQSGQW